MPPKQRRTTAVSLRTREATQRTPQAQTSGIFKLPVEILFEIFSYFGDHRRFIRQTCNSRPYSASMEKEHVERSTAIRKLTMTCWAMRDTLLPVLWKDVEGCVVPSRPRGSFTYGLYDQCVYLLSNPTIAAHVQALSVDLRFKEAPKDLMKKFIDTLVRLPNLRTLNLLSISHRSPVTVGLKRKCANFPNIREMIVSPKYPDFIKSCPNIESLTFRYDLNSLSRTAIDLRGAGLKRIAGLDSSAVYNVRYVVQRCPQLQEIGFFSDLCTDSKEALGHLRRVENLAVVEVNFIGEVEPIELPPDVLEERREAWKKDLIDILKKSPSKDRKFLRWQTINAQWPGYDVVESGELEVIPETSP